MEILTNPKFDFLGKKSYFITASLIIVLASIVSLSIRGITLGIDFRGGADIQLKFRETPPTAQLRAGLDAAGSTGEPPDVRCGGRQRGLIQFDPHIRARLPRHRRRRRTSPRRPQAIRTNEQKAAVQGKLDLNTAG